MWANYDDVIIQLRDAGLDIEAIEVDTPKPRRCREIGGDREKRGWYWLFTKRIGEEDYIVGSFGVFHGADDGKRTVKIRRDGEAVRLSKEEREAIAARQRAHMERLKAEREALAERAARRAQYVWRRYSPAGESSYLKRKRVGAFGIRFSATHDTVAVPMMSADGHIRGLQLIRGRPLAKGKLEKEYWPAGLSKQGCFHLIGGVPAGILLLAEGYATAASLHQATGLPVAAAFDAGNLIHVAKALAKKYRCRILVCADDDYLTPGNPGASAAESAAVAVGGAWLKPLFAEDRAGKKITDFNDLALIEGEAIVRSQIEAKLAELGWRIDGARAGDAKGGEGLASVIQIEEAARRFVMIYGAGGTWFDRREHLLIPKSDLVDMLPEHGMRDLRAIKQVARIDEVGFDPTGGDGRIRCNLWGGWPTKPKPGRCEQLLRLLEYLCSHEENPRELYRWVLKWLAYPIQHPGAKMATALVFHGPQGVGKNLIFESVKAIYGEYGAIIDQAAIEDKFNDWASRKLFLVADEVVARAELYHQKNKIKSLITGEWIRINPKNVAAHTERNHVNLVFLSNEVQPIALENDDRRYVVVWTPAALPKDFYDAVKAEIDAGGVAALHHYLLNLDLGDFHPHSKPPATRAKRQLIDISRDSVEVFIEEWKGGEVTVKDAVLPFCPCLGSHLYQAYVPWAKEAGYLKPRDRIRFIGQIAKLPGWTAGVSLYTRETLLPSSAGKQRKMVVPPEDAIRGSPAGVARRAGTNEPLWRLEDEDRAQWLTRGFFTFADALGVAA